MSTDGQPAEDGRMAGNELPRDALDLASELKAYLGANPHDNTALEAMRDVLRVIEQVQGDSPIEWSTWTAPPRGTVTPTVAGTELVACRKGRPLYWPGGVGKSRLSFSWPQLLPAAAATVTHGSKPRRRHPPSGQWS